MNTLLKKRAADARLSPRYSVDWIQFFQQMQVSRRLLSNHLKALSAGSPVLRGWRKSMTARSNLAG